MLAGWQYFTNTEHVKVGHKFNLLEKRAFCAQYFAEQIQNDDTKSFSSKVYQNPKEKQKSDSPFR